MVSIENYIGKKNFVVPCFYAAMPHVFVPQRCGLTISLFEDENAQEFNVVTEQSKILGFFDILEQLPTLYTKPWRTTTNRACATTGGACTVQNSAATVASQEGYIRRRFHCRVPHKHTVPIKGSYGTHGLDVLE